MIIRTTLAAAMTAALLLGAAGCAVTSGQQPVGAYFDDSTITGAVKAKFVESKDVPGGAISVETLNGTVQLAGFVTSAAQKAAAEDIARKVGGVKAVKNDIVVRP
jgi:hyperosmotically inducible protein